MTLCYLLESDLKALKYSLEKIDSKKVGLVFDTGNVTKNSFLIEKEFALISSKVKEIHIKDYSKTLKKSVRLEREIQLFQKYIKLFKKQIGVV